MTPTAPPFKGDTGIGEFGLKYKASEDSPFEFALGVQGYWGKTRGVTGGLSFTLRF